MNLIEIGEVRGIAKGEEMKLIRLICRKRAKGCSDEEIADMLEEELAVVERISSVAQEFAPEYDCDKIYEKLHVSK